MLCINDIFRIFEDILITNAMKLRFYLLTLVIAGLSSMSLYAQDQYEGEWPSGEGILYSQEKGLVIGEFSKGNPEGICVCYLPNGDVYWGEYRKGKATGHGRIYRDNGIVIAGQYRSGRYHGIDTLYRKDGSVLVARYRNGKLKERIFDSKKEKVDKVFHKPEYPQMDFRRSQENFLREQEIRWERRNIAIREKAGFVAPKFRGGDVDDFALWVNSQVSYPVTDRKYQDSRMVVVEFTVTKDGSVTDIHAVFGSDKVLNEVAEAVVSTSPKWTPGEQNGEKTDVRLSVPIMFSL